MSWEPAAGLSYEDDEPLNSDAKILDRDRNRWELNPASVEDEEDDEDTEDEDEFINLEDLEDKDKNHEDEKDF